jgi:hypothetical protein
MDYFSGSLHDLESQRHYGGCLKVFSCTSEHATNENHEIVRSAEFSK